MSTAIVSPGHGERPERGFRRGGEACAQAPFAGPREKIPGPVAPYSGAERGL